MVLLLGILRFSFTAATLTKVFFVVFSFVEAEKGGGRQKLFVVRVEEQRDGNDEGGSVCDVKESYWMSDEDPDILVDQFEYNFDVSELDKECDGGDGI